MLALILHRVATPIPMGSSSGWLMLAGMMSRPAAISSRIKADGDLFPFCDKGHLFGDLSLARKVHLGHVGIARACCFEFALYDPLSPRLQDLIRAVSVAAHCRIASEELYVQMRRLTEGTTGSYP